MRFHVVHNIPSPYRLHLFAALATTIERRGGTFHVHFMATNHRDRPSSWARDPATLPFAATVSHDLGPVLRGRELHFNPALLASLARARPDVLMVGGPWDTPTGLLASALGFGAFRIAWYEPNTKTPGRVSGPARAVKRSLLSRYDLIAVPGAEGVRYTTQLLGLDRPTAILPNLVDERLFADADDAQAGTLRGELGVAPGERLAVAPARLAAEKGLVELVRILESSWLSGWQIRIVGNGALHAPLQALIKARGLARHVRLVDPLGYERMPALYKAAQLFVLPSLYDPNPLSVVEALHAGVPLLVSRRIGNFPEALREGENGFSFEPSEPEAMRETARRAFSASNEQLAAMGQRSRLQARFWNTSEAIDRFLDVVTNMKKGTH